VVVDKSRGAPWDEVRRASPSGYQVVLDANGVSTLRGSYAHLAPTGRLVVYGFHSMLRRGRERPSYVKLAADFLRTPRFNPIEMTNSNRSVLAFNLSYLFEEEALFQEATGELLAWLGEGTLRAQRTTVFPFDRVADAHGALESGDSVGKVVLVP